MKQKIHYLFMLLLMIIVGAGGVKAEEKTIVIKYNSEFSPALPTSFSAVNSNITEHKVLGLNVKEKEIYKTSGYLMFVQNKGYIFNSEDLGTIKSVTVKYSSGCSTSAKAGVYFGSEQQSAYLSTNNKTIAGTSKSDTWTNTITGNGFFQLSTSNKNCQITQIEIVYDASASSNKENVDLSFGEISSQTVGVGKSVKIEATATPSVLISYSSSDETIATVSTDGTVEGKKPGKATIKASFAGNDQYNSASDEYELTVIPSELGGDVTEETIIINEPYGNSGNNAIILYDKGTNGQNGPFYNNSELRLYCGNTLTVSSESKKIAKIEFDFVVNKNSSGVIPESIKYTTSGSCEEFIVLSTSLTSAIWNAPTNGVSEVTFTIYGSAGNVGFKSAKVYYVLESFEVVPASNNESYGTVSFEEGVITATPAEGYRVSLTNPDEVTPAGAATVVQNGNDFTVTATADCTVQINFEAIPTHTVTFSVNGTETSKSFAEGSNITFDIPADVLDKKFVGWTTAPIKGETDEKPATLVNAATMGNEDVTYYAVYAAKKGEGVSKTATLTNANIVAAGDGKEGYNVWAITDSDDRVWNARAIKNQHSNATSEYHYLQIKKSSESDQYYIQVPEMGGTITAMTMTVSGSNQPMTGGSNSSKLFFSNSNLTSATGNGAVSGEGVSTVTLDCYSLGLSAGYITSSGAVRIWDVKVTYGTPATYSGYCTTVVAPVKPAKPIIFHDDGGEYEGELTVAIAGEGVKYTLNDGAEETYAGPFTISDEGEYTIKAWAEKDGVKSDVAEKTFTIVEKTYDGDTFDGYYTIKNNNGNNMFVNVAGRKTVTFESETADKAGTVIRVKTNDKGQVEVLRSQGVDLPRYAEKAMNYVPELAKALVERLGENDVIGEDGVNLIANEFKNKFDYHLYLEKADGGYRIYGKTPSMKHVVDFYANNKEIIDSRLPKLEGFVEDILKKVAERLNHAGSAWASKFKILDIWAKLVVTNPDLTKPEEGNAEAISKFYTEILSSEANIWNFAHETMMIYWTKVDQLINDPESQYASMLGDLGDYKKYLEKVPNILPNFKYYIVSDGSGIDFISEGNEDIINDAARTVWTLEGRENFNVTFLKDNALSSGRELYTTLYTDFAYKLPDGVKAYAITGVNETTGVATKEEFPSNIIPAQTPVLLQATFDAEQTADQTKTLELTTEAGTTPETNLLVGADELINQYMINSSTAVTLLDMLSSISQSLAGQYSYLARKNAGTVNNKYFFALDNADLDLCTYKLENGSNDCIVRSLSTGNEKVGFYNNWEAKANQAFLINEINPVKLFLKGDVNRSGDVTVADVNALVEIVLGKVTEAENKKNYDFEAAHVNADEEITIADVTALVNIILGKTQN